MESRKKRRKRSKRLTSSRYKIRVRYKYHYYRWINTKDYGSYKDIYEKYKDKGYTYWCADLPPEFSNQDGTWTGYRLDRDKTHTASTLKRYGRHKSWIDPQYRFEGKPVILVYNAACLGKGITIISEKLECKDKTVHWIQEDSLDSRASQEAQ